MTIIFLSRRQQRSVWCTGRILRCWRRKGSDFPTGREKEKGCGQEKKSFEIVSRGIGTHTCQDGGTILGELGLWHLETEKGGRMVFKF